MEAGTWQPQGGSKRKRGEPPTEEQTRKILTYVRAGNYVETASAVAGVSRDVFRKWLELGNAPNGEKKHPKCYALARGLDVAQEESIAAGLATISGAARAKKITKEKTTTDAEGKTRTTVETIEDRGAWQAEAWRLERMHPERFALRVRHTVEIEIGSMLDALERGLDPDTYARVLEVLAASETGAPA
jgi:hypothetical protein